jgi:hypothetical protein
LKKDRGAAPEMEATLWARRAWRRVPNLDVHNVKERGVTGAVVIGVRAHGTRARAHAQSLSAHELGLDVLRLVLRAICPPALTAEGGPCAGYSGFSLEPCSEVFIELEKPQ